MEETLPKLTGKQARYLRSIGHSLKPLLQIGRAGITDSFIDQVRRILETHELVKIKIGKNTETKMDPAIEELTTKVPCQLAQSIGKTLLLYKPREEDPQIVLPG
jgi:RNA-binding protein